MTLRSKIEHAISQHKNDPHNAALAVCVVLDDEIGLAGNGWFDNDREARKALGMEED